MANFITCQCGKQIDVSDVADTRVYCDQCGRFVDVPFVPTESELKAVGPEIPGRAVRITMIIFMVLCAGLAGVTLLAGAHGVGKLERERVQALGTGLCFATVPLGLWWLLLRRGAPMRGEVSVFLGTVFYLFGVFWLVVAVATFLEPVVVGLTCVWYVIMAGNLAAHAVAAYHLTFFVTSDRE